MEWLDLPCGAGWSLALVNKEWDGCVRRSPQWLPVWQRRWPSQLDTMSGQYSSDLRGQYAAAIESHFGRVGGDRVTKVETKQGSIVSKIFGGSAKHVHCTIFGYRSKNVLREMNLTAVPDGFFTQFGAHGIERERDDEFEMLTTGFGTSGLVNPFFKDTTVLMVAIHAIRLEDEASRIITECLEARPTIEVICVVVGDGNEPRAEALRSVSDRLALQSLLQNISPPLKVIPEWAVMGVALDKTHPSFQRMRQWILDASRWKMHSQSSAGAR